MKAVLLAIRHFAHFIDAFRVSIWLVWALRRQSLATVDSLATVVGKLQGHRSPPLDLESVYHISRNLTFGRRRKSCLRRSFLQFYLLSGSDRDVALHVGCRVRRGSSLRLESHSWISVDGVAIWEIADRLRKFRPIATFYASPGALCGNRTPGNHNADA